MFNRPPENSDPLRELWEKLRQDSTPRDQQMIVLIDDLALPGSWLPPYATWLPWGSTLVSNILIFRNMEPTTPQFDRSVQAAIAAKCAIDNPPGNTPPPRQDVINGGRCAERVMKAFYPKAVFCDESVFQRGGWQACFGQ